MIQYVFNNNTHQQSLRPDIVENNETTKQDKYKTIYQENPIHLMQVFKKSRYKII